MGRADELATNLLSAAADYQMLQRGDRVLIALSGGADSTALAVLLNEQTDKLGISLHAAHLNHCLRGDESDRDENHVRNLCKRIGLPLTVERIDVAKAAAEDGGGIEETARRIRYAFLERVSDSLGCTKIATAHNLNDNAETVIMNLIRGTGLRGLTGIPPVRGRIIRPLLYCSRESIESFLKDRDIEFVTDHTNFDTKFLRNRIRHRILPLLCEINPLFVDNITEFTKLLRSDAEYLEATAETIPISDSDDVAVARDLLTSLPVGLAGRVVKRLYAIAYGKLHATSPTNEGNSSVFAPDLALKHTVAVIELAAGSSASGEVHLPGGVLACCRYGKILFTGKNLIQSKECANTCSKQQKAEEEKPLRLGETIFGSWTITVEIVDTIEYESSVLKKKTIHSSGGSSDDNFCEPHALDIYNSKMSNIVNVVFLDPRLIDSGLYVRGYQTGDSISPIGRGWTKTLKKLYVEMKIPRQERAFRPVIVSRSGICAIPGHKADKKFAAKSPPALKVTFQLTKEDAPRDG